MNESPHVEPELFSLTTGDGLELFARRWAPSAMPRATVVLVHGLGEHAGRYEGLATRLVHAGYEVAAHDQRGYGRSPRKRWPLYDELLDDLESMLATVADDRPVFLLGQSFGGNLVLNFALRRAPSVQGLVAASPMLRLAQPPPAWKHFALRTASHVLPNLSVKTGIRAEQLTSNVERQETYLRDDLIRRRVALRLAREMIDSGEWAAMRGNELASPALLLHGDADEVTCYQASRDFSSSAAACDFLGVPAGRHELLHSGAEAADQIIDWMNRR